MLALKIVTVVVIFSLSLAFSISGQAPAAKSTQSLFTTGSEPTVFLQESISVPNKEAAPTFTV